METEIWRDIKGFEGLYKISDHGRIKSIPRDRIIGEMNLVTLCKNSEVSYMYIKDILFDTFGTIEFKGTLRKEYKKQKRVEREQKKIRKAEQLISDEQNKNWKEILINQWYSVSGTTTHIDYFKYRYNLNINNIVHFIHEHVGKDIHINVINESDLTINWDNKYTTNDNLSIIILRYFLIRKGIVSTVPIRSRLILYPEELKTYRSIIYTILGFSKYFDDSDDSDDSDDDDDDEDDIINIKFDKTRDQIADHSLSNSNNNNNNKNSEIDNINIDGIDRLNYNNFISPQIQRGNDNDPVFTQLVFDLIPPFFRDITREDVTMKRTWRRKAGKQEMMNVFLKVVDKLYPNYSLSSICVEVSGYFSVNIFNFYKNLDSNYQKMIIREVFNYENR